MHMFVNLVGFESWISDSQFLGTFHVKFVATDLQRPTSFGLSTSTYLTILWQIWNTVKVTIVRFHWKNEWNGSYTTSLKLDLVLKQLFSLNSDCYEDTFFKKRGNIFRLHRRV